MVNFDLSLVSTEYGAWSAQDFLKEKSEATTTALFPWRLYWWRLPRDCCSSCCVPHVVLHHHLLGHRLTCKGHTSR